jgi:nucleoside-diphosphate-sugar epimerase
MKKNVIVTGATGFIGKALCKQLEKQNYNVIPVSTLDGDIANTSILAKYHGNNVIHVFHLAGLTFVPASWEKPDEFIKTNVLGTTSVLEFCRLNNAGMTLVSAYLYGADVINPISEDTVPAPNNPYALSKKMAEDVCKFYAEYYHVNCSILRPFNVYGTGQGEHFLIPSIISQIKEGNEVKVKDLEPKRDYIHINDLVECLSQTIRLKGFAILNVGSGKSYSVKEVIDLLMKVCGVNLPIHSENNVRRNEISDTIANISRANLILGWQPKINLEQGLRLILDQDNRRF